MSDKSKYNSLQGLADMNKADFNLDSLVDGMKDYNMKDLYFMRDCIDFMIIYKKQEKEIA